MCSARRDPGELLEPTTDLDAPAGHIPRARGSGDEASQFCASAECRQGGVSRDPRGKAVDDRVKQINRCARS